MKKSLAKKIASYAVTGAAVTVGGVNMAEADVCDSTTIVTLEADMIGQSVDVDIDGDGVFDFNLSVFNNSTSFSEAFVISGLGANLIGPETGGGTFAGNRNYIGGFSNSFAGTSAIATGALAVTYGSTNFGTFPIFGQAGLQFDIGGQTHFGAIFLDAEVEGQGIGELTLSFQWEKEAGVAFNANPVPEPTSLALLALGTVGLASRRRRS